MDVPIGQQTRECLIAQVEAMDKQAKDNGPRMTVLERMAKSFSTWQKFKARYEGWDPEDKRLTYMAQMEKAWAELESAQKELDTLTPEPKDKETS